MEKYLRQCLDSCLDQDIPKSEYEIIIVNDGSPDNSQVIINEYALLYDNICVIMQYDVENQEVKYYDYW